MTRYFMTIAEASCARAPGRLARAGAEAQGALRSCSTWASRCASWTWPKQMIRLSWRRDGPIGHRIGHRHCDPGEKLHEELWGEGESAVSTSHPKIMRVSGPIVDAVWLQDELGELERLVREGETLEVVSRLATMMRAPRLVSEPGAREGTVSEQTLQLEPSGPTARVARWTTRRSSTA